MQKNSLNFVDYLIHVIKESDGVFNSIVKPGDNPNEDYLIPRSNLYAYVRRDQIDDVRTNGILINKDIDGVRVFLSRIPTGNPKTDEFLKLHQPVKVSIAKLNKSANQYDVYGANIPKVPEKLIKLTPETINKLTNSEDKLFNFYGDSQDDGFSDVPHAIIKSTSDRIPAFACSVIPDVIQESAVEKYVNCVVTRIER